MKAQFEALWTLETNSFNASLQEKKEFDVPLHYHPEYELTYILSSTGVRYAGNSFENFKENDLVLLGPGLPHCWKNFAKQKDAARAIVIHWKEDFLGNGWIECKEFELIKKMFQLSVKGIRFDDNVAAGLKDQLVALTRLSPFERLLSFLQVLQKLAGTGKYRLLCEDAFAGNLNYTDNERINTAYQYVKKNFAGKITLADIASQVNMQEESFSRFFSKVMRKTFFYFLNEYRINFACRLLIETDKDVAEICYACGYESLPFFYRQFKKFKQHTPQKYRQVYLEAGKAEG